VSEAHDLLERAVQSAATNPVELTVRELLGHWGAKRRGYWIVETITQDLAENGLSTDPPFEDAWIDEQVKLVKAKGHITTTAPPVASGVAGEPGPAAALRVRHIQSSKRTVVSVPPDAALSLAQALMLKNDYSQLAVMSGPRSLRGAVSWKSIAQAQLRDQGCSLGDTIIPAVPVNLDDELLPLIPTIVEREFLFVLAQDNTVGGIVTMADLSLEYNQLARPFFLIGEIERRLRRAISDNFDQEALHNVRDPGDSGREVASAEDLAFGEYKRLLEKPDNWQRLQWNVDRTVFISTLDEVRTVRNEVMHFSPDPIDEEQLTMLTNFIRWVKVLDPRP